MRTRVTVCVCVCDCVRVVCKGVVVAGIVHMSMLLLVQSTLLAHVPERIIPCLQRWLCVNGDRARACYWCV